MTNHTDKNPPKSTALIAVTGAAGMLGRDVTLELDSRALPYRVYDRAMLNITSHEACAALFAENPPPTTVINCAAYTDVNRAESEEELANTINGDGPRNLAAACAQFGARLIHVSTDYVFDGTKAEPYNVNDPTFPLNAYGRSKLRGEQAIVETLQPDQFTIARTSWLYGAAGPNFVKTMLRLARDGKPLKVINDQTGAPTYTADLGRALVKLALLPAGVGIVHATNAGACTWFEFAKAIFAETRVHPPSLEPCATADFATPARRPANSQLAPDSLLRARVVPLPHWRDGLRRYLAEAGELAP